MGWSFFCRFGCQWGVFAVCTEAWIGLSSLAWEHGMPQWRYLHHQAAQLPILALRIWWHWHFIGVIHLWKIAITKLTTTYFSPSRAFCTAWNGFNTTLLNKLLIIQSVSYFSLPPSISLNISCNITMYSTIPSCKHQILHNACCCTWWLLWAQEDCLMCN